MDRPLTTIPRVAVVLLFCALAPRSAPADSVTFVVPTDFTTIQAALDRAHELVNGPTPTTTSYSVLVEPGTYPGGITLRPNIPLRGRETMRTILTGGSSVIMTAPNVAGTSVRNFTFRNATVGIAVSGTQKVTIENNVFAVGPGGIGVQVSGNTNPTTIINNTFTQNQTAVTRAGNTVVVTNNIFSDNTTNLSPNFTSEPNVTYNIFDPDRGATEPRGTFFIPNIALPDPDPLFVDAAVLDLHLRAASPCIDQGDPTILDTSLDDSRSDMGAYGGPNADGIPAQVKGALATASTTTPPEITVTWSASTDHAVAGYKVYYGYASGTYDGNDALVSGVSATSPVDAGSVTSLLFTGLTLSAATPTAPVLNAPLPRNNALALSWSAVPGATGYRVHYGIASTAENTVEAGSTTAYTLTGLTNGTTYLIAVSAIAQAVYYFNVTAYDKSTQAKAAGVSHESAFAGELAVLVGPVNESGLSLEKTGMPEMLIPYPNLPNTGCFIATAAYGSGSGPAVRELRRFRDRWLLTNTAGRSFVRWYYANSPAAARWLEQHPSLKPLVRAALAPVVVAAFLVNESPGATAAIIAMLLSLAAMRRVRKRSSPAQENALTP